MADTANRHFIRLLTTALMPGLMLALSGFADPAWAYSPPKAAMVIDGYTGKVLYSSNANTKRYPASITKVMTLYLLFEQMREGRFTMKSPLKVSATAAARPPSKLGLKPGSTISVHDAVHALVTKSANDVAAVVAENIAGSEPKFARLMTAKARELGMTDTVFRNASGLPDATQVSTASDLVILGRRMLTDFPKLSKIFNTRYFKFGKRKFRNHNRLLFNYKGMEGLKTGFTRASGFNLLASCRRNGKFLIAVVLGGRSAKARNVRMRGLLDRSWKRAVALKDFKKSKPIAIAGVVQRDNMPERNPAFHSVGPDFPREFANSDTADEGIARQQQLSAAFANVTPPEIVISEPTPEKKPQVTRTASLTVPAGPYHIQVGSFLSPQHAESHLASVSGKAQNMLEGHKGHTVEGVVKGVPRYRARYSQFSQAEANQACAALKKLNVDCLVVRVE